MRVSEVIHLRYDDISRTNMQIHIRDAKNRMDRYTGQYLTVSTLEQVMRRAVAIAEHPVVFATALRHISWNKA